MSLLIERQIRSRLDMAEIESTITKVLGGENNRCAFLRSKAYMQLRLAALYHVDPQPMTVFHDPMSVSLGKGPEGEKKITVRLAEPVYDLRFMGSDVEESESPEKKQRH